MPLKHLFSFYLELLVNSCIINSLSTVCVSEFTCSFPSAQQNYKLSEVRLQALFFSVLSLGPSMLNSALHVVSAQEGFPYWKPSRLCLSPGFQVLGLWASLKDWFQQTKTAAMAPDTGGPVDFSPLSPSERQDPETSERG